VLDRVLQVANAQQIAAADAELLPLLLLQLMKLAAAAAGKN